MTSLHEAALHDDPGGLAVDLLARLSSLVALALAHMELHPAAYENPCGQLLGAQVQQEAQCLLGRKSSL